MPLPAGRSQRGHSLIMMALSIGAVLSMLGVVFDGGRMYFARRILQGAADAAAIAAAREMVRGNYDMLVSAGRADALLNGFNDAANDVLVTINNPPLSGPNAGDAQFVEAYVTRRYDLTFSRLFTGATNDVGARSVAGLEPDWDPPCVLALNETAGNALEASGSSDLFAPDCTIMANSNSPSAIRANGGGCITGKRIGFVQPGSYLTNGGNCVSPTPLGRAVPTPDPFAYLTEPDPAAYPMRSNKRLKITAGNASSITPLQPGYYKGGISMTGGSLTFLPGLYIVEGMKITGGSISGSDVTFFNNGQGLQGIEVSGNVDSVLNAPTAGPYQNILFFNSRSIPKNNQTEVKISGTPASTFEGVLYFPTVHLQYAGNSQNANVWSMVVADTIGVTGNANVNVAYSWAGGRTPTTMKVALVE